MKLELKHPRKEAHEALLQRALDIVKKAKRPVSIEFVAFHLKIPWHRAKGLLLELVARNELEMIDTTKSLVFMSPEWIENNLRKAKEEERDRDVMEKQS